MLPRKSKGLIDRYCDRLRSYAIGNGEVCRARGGVTARRAGEGPDIVIRELPRKRVRMIDIQKPGTIQEIRHADLGGATQDPVGGGKIAQAQMQETSAAKAKPRRPISSRKHCAQALSPSGRSLNRRQHVASGRWYLIRSYAGAARSLPPVRVPRAQETTVASDSPRRDVPVEQALHDLDQRQVSRHRGDEEKVKRRREVDQPEPHPDRRPREYEADHHHANRKGG
jgi:hypothetical protein